MSKLRRPNATRLARAAGRTSRSFLVTVLCIVIGLVIFLPIGGVLASSLNENLFASLYGYHVRSSGLGDMGLYGWSDKLKDVLLKPEFLRYLQNSVVTSVLATIIRITIGTLAAFALAVKRFKGKKIVLLLILGTMMIPEDVLLIPNFVTISHLNLRNTYLGIISVNLVSAIHIFMLYQCFRSLGSALREAAYIDGCNDFKFMTKVCIPCGAPVIAALTIHSFIFVWNDYLWPLLMSDVPETRTLTVALQEGWKYSYSIVLTISLMPPLLLFLMFQKTLVRGLTTGSVVG